jgi:hypothetical protein
MRKYCCIIGVCTVGAASADADFSCGVFKESSERGVVRIGIIADLPSSIGASASAEGRAQQGATLFSVIGRTGMKLRAACAVYGGMPSTVFAPGRASGLRGR